jgi:hypothetical protein
VARCSESDIEAVGLGMPAAALSVVVIGEATAVGLMKA